MTPAAQTKRFNDLEAWISSGYRNGKPLTEEDYDRLEAERDALIQEHGPDFAQKSRSKATGEGYRPPAGTQPRSRTGAHGKGRQRRGGTPAPSQHRRRRSTSGAGGGPSSYAGQAGQSLWTGTGLSSSADSISRMAMKGLGLIIGLSLLYLVVKPNGSRAFSTATNTGSNLLHAFISPNVDPLQRASSKAAPAAAPIVGRSSSSLGTARLMQASQALNQQARTPGNGVRPVPRAGLTLRPTTTPTLPGH